jgi:uncharacterized protein (TIGR03435 family)
MPAVRVEVIPVSSVLAEYAAEPIAIEPVPAASIASSQHATVAPVPRWTPGLREILAVVWLGGLLLFGLPVVVGVVQVRRFRRTGVPWLDGQRVVSALASEAGLRRPVDVALHESIGAPATCGIRRHVILFPIDARTWSDDDIARAAVHELEHVRRADSLISAFARIICAAYWFHPLAWVAWRRLTLEAERACDDAVLRRAEPTTYADQLVKLAGRLTTNSQHPLLAMANRNDLVQRVAAVLDHRQARGRAGFTLGAVITVAALTAAIAISPLQAVSGPPAVTVATTPPVVSLGARPSDVVERPTAGPVNVQRSAPAPPPVTSSLTTRARVDIPRWEAVSIRPCPAPGGRGRVAGPRGANLPSLSPGRMVLRCETVASLVASAYVLRANGQQQPFWAVGESGTPIEGGPEWVRSEAYTINAVAEGTPAYAMMQGPMLQRILEDRFKLKTRREARDVPVFHLTVGPRGATLQPFIAGSCVPIDPALEEIPPPRLPEGQRYCGRFVTPKLPNFDMDAEGTTVEEFARMFLSGTPFVGRRVIDRTGIVGRFNIRLEFAPPRPDGDPAGFSTSAGASIFTALQEQLGLKLEPARGTVEALVIESAERPTEN